MAAVAGARARDRARRGRLPLGRPGPPLHRRDGEPLARPHRPRPRGDGRGDRAQLRTLEAFHTFGDVANPPALELVDRLVALSPMTDPRVFLCLGGGDAIDTRGQARAPALGGQGPAGAHPPDQPHVRLPRHARLRHEPRRHGVDAPGLRPAARIGLARRPPVARGARGRDRARRARQRRRLLLRAGDRRRRRAPGARRATSRRVAAICKRHGVLLVIDSVICAFGRVGTWLGYERWDIEPDMVVLAKGITSGYLPLGGVVVSAAVAEPFWSTARRRDVPPRRHLRRPPDLLRRRAREPRHPRAREPRPARARARGRADGHPRAAGRARRVRRDPRRPRPRSRRRPHAGGAREVPGAMVRYSAAIREAGVLLRRRRPASRSGRRSRSSARTWTRSRAPCAPGSTPSRRFVASIVRLPCVYRPMPWTPRRPRCPAASSSR